MTLLEALKHIRKNGPTNPILGICAAASELVGRRKDSTIATLSKGWVRYSGVEGYPVPDPTGRIGAEVVFMAEFDLWDRDTEYGQLRWELLDFLIETLEGK